MLCAPPTQCSQAATDPLVRCLQELAGEIILPGRAHGYPSEAACLSIWRNFVAAAQQHTDFNQHYRAAVANGGRRWEEGRQLREEIGMLASACGVQTTYWEAVVDTIRESNRKVPLFLLKEHALNTLRCMAEAGQLPFSSNHQRLESGRPGILTHLRLRSR